MASIVCSSAPVVAVKASIAFKPATKQAVAAAPRVANAKKVSAFQVWTPVDNKFFETFSFLPALSDGEISKQVEYMVRNAWTPCLEFSDPENAYIANTNTVRMGAVSSNYYDNRYWTMWKLPMFGCTDGSQVLKEVQACTKAFPNAYIRLVAFDASRQVQVAGFLVHRPASAKEWRQPNERSI